MDAKIGLPSLSPRHRGRERGDAARTASSSGASREVSVARVSAIVGRRRAARGGAFLYARVWRGSGAVRGVSFSIDALWSFRCSNGVEWRSYGGCRVCGVVL